MKEGASLFEISGQINSNVRGEQLRLRREEEKMGIIEAAKKLIASGMELKNVCEMLGISKSDLT